MQECSVGWRDQTDGVASISAMPKSDARVGTDALEWLPRTEAR